MSFLVPLLPSFKSLKENLDAAMELAKRAASVEAQERIITLREQVIQLQEAALQLQERNKELEQKMKLKEQLQWDGRVYWLAKDDGTREGPYCQVCQDKDEKLTRLQSRLDTWVCLICKMPYVKINSELSDEDRKIIEQQKAHSRGRNASRTVYPGIRW